MRNDNRDKQSRILLGVTGGIASYKSIFIARQLTELGVEVDVIMTAGAQEFIGPITFEAVTGRKVHTEIFGSGNALDHIRLSREADAILVAPATAEFMARAAGGHANDLLAATLLAATCPVVIAPAMNDRMWAHPQSQNNVRHLREIGYTVIDPDTGPLAVGEGIGPGRLPEAETIVAHLHRAMNLSSPLRGKNIVITAGATREPLDPVRFISNYSSGKTGIAIAKRAWELGANVTLVHGHIDVPVPGFIPKQVIATTIDLQQAIIDLLPHADVLIMAAAPADYRTSSAATSKIKKSGSSLSIELTENPDILRTTREYRKPGSITVGFALETDTVLDYAAQKLEHKLLDLIVANQAGVPDSGFGVDTNKITVLDSNGEKTEFPTMSKTDVARALLEIIEGRLVGR